MGGWWHQMIEAGSGRSTYVQDLRGDPARWDNWNEIRRCNPLVEVSATFRRKLLEERDAARRDSRLKARFMSYRLNLPSADEATMLADRRRLGADDGAPGAASRGPSVLRLRPGRQPGLVCSRRGLAQWSHRGACCRARSARSRPAGKARPGAGRNLSPAGGNWGAAADRRNPRPETRRPASRVHWPPGGVSEGILCDRFKLPELKDAVNGATITPRVTRWSEATEDIGALRRLAADGPLAIEERSRLVLAASLSAAMVKNDDQGSTRMVKRSTNNTARDDVAAALVLGAGALARSLARVPVRRKVRVHMVR